MIPLRLTNNPLPLEPLTSILDPKPSFSNTTQEQNCEAPVKLSALDQGLPVVYFHLLPVVPVEEWLRGAARLDRLR